MPQNLTDDKSTLVQVMAWCRQATSHCLSQSWPRSLSPYGVTGGQWVKMDMDGLHILMAQCMTAISPLLMHWRYYCLALSHWYSNRRSNSPVDGCLVFCLGIQCVSLPAIRMNNRFVALDALVNLKGTMHIKTLRSRQNGRHFADNIFKCIFLNENFTNFNI